MRYIVRLVSEILVKGHGKGKARVNREICKTKIKSLRKGKIQS